MDRATSMWNSDFIVSKQVTVYFMRAFYEAITQIYFFHSAFRYAFNVD